MSSVVRSRSGATCLSCAALVYALVMVVACGSDKKTSGTLDQIADGNSTTSDGNSVTSVSNSAYSTKMARQTSDDVQSNADLSESASTGMSDGGGTQEPESHGRKHGFDMNTNPNMDYNNVSAGFEGNITLTGARIGGAELHGSCGLKVSPQHSGQQPGPMGQQNLVVVLESDIQTVTDNNDTIEVKTEPNVVITRTGSRQSGTVTRTVNGQVHRTLTSTTNPNLDFNITLNHNGHIVIDTYGAAPTYLLSKRVINGVSTVTDAGRGITSTITFENLARDDAKTCFCPTSGKITQQVTQNGQVTTHAYVFSGTCGKSQVSIDGSAAVAAQASGAAQSGNNVASTVSSSTAASAEVHGSLAWENCVPTAADTAN